MVRRLVERNEIARQEHHLCEREPAAFAAGKPFDLSKYVVAKEPEPSQVISYGIGRPLGPNPCDLLEERFFRIELTMFLIVVAKLDTLPHMYGSRQRRLQPQQRPQQRRLSGPVRPYDADAIAP